MKILIGTKSFGKYSDVAMDKLTKEFGYDIYPEEALPEVDGIIAGTEKYTKEVLAKAVNLKTIARMGVGVDNIDLDYCSQHGITVTTTPDAPSNEVAELTICHIINLLRGISQSNLAIHNDNQWTTVLGKSMSEVSIGVLGVGRIGKKVIEKLQPFAPANIFAFDTDWNMVADYWVDSGHSFRLARGKHELFTRSDLVTIHIPMSSENYQHIKLSDLRKMATGSYLVNTSRGPVIDEYALFYAMQYNHLAGIALDVFTHEPYRSIDPNLTGLWEYQNVIMSCHMGGMTSACRLRMEMEAVMNCHNTLEEQK